MAAPAYAKRIGRLPDVLEVLAAHPGGMPLTDLAAMFGIAETELREDLLAFFAADVNGLLGLARPTVLAFLGPDGADDDPHRAEVVRITDARPSGELGVEYVDAAELGLIYTAARALDDLEPGNEDLAGAIDVLTETMFGQARVLAEDGGGDLLGPLRRAIETRQRVRIVYSWAWWPGVRARCVDPYRLVQTRRGWELDAGPADEAGRLRTYLLTNIRSLDLTGDTYPVPTDLDRLLAAQRTTFPVRLRVPHTARWAADMYAERVAVVADTEDSVTLDLMLLPPVDRRLGLLLLACGPDAAVLSPPGAVESVRVLAAELLEHHLPTPTEPIGDWSTPESSLGG